MPKPILNLERGTRLETVSLPWGFFGGRGRMERQREARKSEEKSMSEIFVSATCNVMLKTDLNV